MDRASVPSQRKHMYLTGISPYADHNYEKSMAYMRGERVALLGKDAAEQRRLLRMDCRNMPYEDSLQSHFSSSAALVGEPDNSKPRKLAVSSSI